MLHRWHLYGKVWFIYEPTVSHGKNAINPPSSKHPESTCTDEWFIPSGLSSMSRWFILHKCRPRFAAEVFEQEPPSSRPKYMLPNGLTLANVYWFRTTPTPDVLTKLLTSASRALDAHQANSSPSRDAFHPYTVNRPRFGSTE